jgi:hypothetical protein
MRFKRIKVSAGVAVMFVKDLGSRFTYLLIFWPLWMLCSFKEFKFNLPVPVLEFK